MKRTRRGSSHNATTCGIFSKILLSGEAMKESEEDYLALLSGLRSKFRPANGHERLLVDKLTYLYLRLTRVYKSDARLAGKIFARVERALKDDGQPINTAFVGENKEFQIILLPKGPSPDLLIRYEANIERQIARTLEQLDREHQMRQRDTEPPDETSGINADPKQEG